MSFWYFVIDFIFSYVFETYVMYFDIHVNNEKCGCKWKSECLYMNYAWYHMRWMNENRD